MNICESLSVTSKLFPEKVAIIFGEQQLTYAQLNSLSVAAADVLKSQGVGPGDRVALMLPNAVSFPVWYYATLRIGAIAVSVSTRLAPSEVEYVLSDCGAKVFVASEPAFQAVSGANGSSVSARFAVKDDSGKPLEEDVGFQKGMEQKSANVWYNAEPDDAALILYTSGTTGFPKGATLSHGNVRSNVHAFNHLCNMQSDDRVLLAVPLFHCFGQNALLNSVLNVGGTIVLQQRFDLNESKRLIASHKVSQLYGVPMMFGLMLESCSQEDLASVKYCFSAAATLPIQTSQAWQAKFSMPIYEGYGLTETSPFATYNHRTKFLAGSIGMAIDSVEIKIADPESGESCGPGELGEIAIRGPNVMLGYWNRPEETAQAIRNGWFHSGDIGRIDEDGYLYIVDRVKDMITIGGLKVFPAEVERVLLDHESVSQAAVIGVPDPVFGEQVVGYLVLDDQADRETIIREVELLTKQNLGNYKVPRQLIAIEELPRNPSGKVLKTKLREMAAESFGVAQAGDADSDMPALPANLKPATLRRSLESVYESEKLRVAIEFLQTQIQELCELEEPPAASESFIEAGLDSLAIVGLSAQLQVEVGTTLNLPPTLLFDYPRVEDLARFLVGTLTGENLQSNDAEMESDAQPSSSPTQLRTEVEQMSEEQALAELMKELG